MSSERRKGKRKTARKNIKQLSVKLLLYVWQFFHSFIDDFIDWCFHLYYGDSKKIQLPKIKDSILMESAVSLAERIRNKEITSEKVVQCFIERIKEVNPILNAVVEERFTIAMEEAKEVDRLLATGTLSQSDLIKNKPFLGVPFTTKDSTSTKGMKHTLGLVCRQDIRASEDADVITLMKNAGAIVIGITNIPEFNLWVETRNNIYGQTNNPYDTRRCVGGSSGGEGAIIAACGSPLGVGTDIGGSIRLPAFCCGIFGHKPSNDLTPLKGLTRRTGNEGPTMVVAGPMCKYAQDLTPFLKVLIGDKVSLLKLDEKVNLGQIEFFYMEEIKHAAVSPIKVDMHQALLRAVEYFRHVSEKPVRKLEFNEINYGYKLWRYWMKQEPFDFAYEISNRQRRVSVWPECFAKVKGTSLHTLPAILRLLDDKLPQEHAQWARDTTTHLRRQLLEELGSNGVLLFPSSPMVASYHYSYFLRPYNFAYFAVFNALQLPVTQVPMGLNGDGIPVGIQVVAAPNNDHLCIAVAQELQKEFSGWVPPFAV